LDNTYGSFPDWVEVDFNGSKTLSEIDVITQQDNPQNPVEPIIKRDKESGAVNINAKVSEAYPNAPSPAIDYDFNITVKDQHGKVMVGITGQHDGFPAYEVFAVREGDDKEQRIYSHDPRDTGQTGLSLFGSGEFKVNIKPVILEPGRRRKDQE